MRLSPLFTVRTRAYRHVCCLLKRRKARPLPTPWCPPSIKALTLVWISTSSRAVDGSRTIPFPPTSPSGAALESWRNAIGTELRGILETAAKATNRDANEQKIGDYYSACMDEAAIEKKGIAVLKPEFDRINRSAR